jgi:hypothetical protein
MSGGSWFEGKQRFYPLGALTAILHSEQNKPPALCQTAQAAIFYEVNMI